MKKLIVIFIMPILFGSAYAEQTRTHKKWTWTTQASAQGTFVAVTKAANAQDNTFGIVARPTKEGCAMTYVFNPSKASLKIKDKKDIPLQFNIDGKNSWIGTGEETFGTGSNTRILVRSPNITKSLSEIAQGTHLYFAVTEEKDTVYTYSLAGSAAAIKAIWSQCLGKKVVSPPKRIRSANAQKHRRVINDARRKEAVRRAYGASSIPGIVRSAGYPDRADAMERREERMREEGNRQSRHDDYMRELRNLNNREIRCSTSYGRSTGGNNWADTTCR
jgi:hypothetical protein